MTQIHYMISNVDYPKPLPIQFKMCGSTSQVSSGYLNFSSSRALFCSVRRSKSLIEYGSFVISFTEMLVFPVWTVSCHVISKYTLWQCSTVIWLHFYSFSSSTSSWCDTQFYCYRQILHVREVKLFIPNLDSFLKYKLSLIRWACFSCLQR